MNIDKQKAVAFTGNRKLNAPQSVRISNLKFEVFKHTYTLIEEAYHDGKRQFLSGMAQGFDMIAAEAVLKLRDEYDDVELIAVIPFEGQANNFSYEDQIGAINDSLWEVVSWYFGGIEGYTINHDERTITAADGELSELFYYWSGSRNRPYKSLRKYGMSPSFKPHTGRITLTSVLGRNVLNEVACADEGQITVDADIEPCTIGLYGVKIKSKGELENKIYYTYIGCTQSGATLSDADCRAIMELPIKEFEEKSQNDNQPNYNSRIFVGASSRPNPLDTLIDRESYIARQLTESESAAAEEVSVMKRKTAIAKSALEREAESLKVEIKRAEKVLAGAVDRISKIKADKQVKILSRDLRQREDSIFMDGMRLDVALEEQIKAFTSEQRFSAEVLRHFVIVK